MNPKKENLNESMQLKALIDNDVLVNFSEFKEKYGLDIFLLLPNIFENILIPVQIKEEFEEKAKFQPTRSFLLASLAIDKGFMRLCANYDEADFNLIKTVKGMDRGESGAVAQSQKTDIFIFITNDKSCTEVIKRQYSNIRCMNDLFLLALLDLHGYLQNKNQLFKEYGKISGINNQKLQKAYREASEFIYSWVWKS